MKRLRSLLVLLSASLSVGVAKAGIEHLLPQPRHVQRQGGNFEAQQIATKGLYLQEEMKSLLAEYGLTVDPKSRYSIETVIVPSLPQVWFNKSEAYRIKVNKTSIRVEALERLGLYRGLQTVGQLLASASKPGFVEGCEIIDWPAFRVRGYMHDVGRTYIPLEDLKAQLKLLARYKVNVFHWHLTENQAWRLESKAYPQLTSEASMTRMPGKYYTLQEARELADYCKQLRITLIPEIDMPGHSAAFERAMGFGMQTAEGKKVLKTILSEVAEAMDVPYIHIGTDEVKFTDPTFVPEMVAHVRSLGRKAISWNPGWEYQLGQIDMLHLWSSRGRAIKGVPAIDSRLHYINHYDMFADIVMLYNSMIHRVSESNTNTAGSILAIWNDRFIPDVKSILAQNMFYPAMLALAERAWLGGGTGYFDKPTVALSFDAPETLNKQFNDFERRMLWHKKRFFRGEPFPYVRQGHATWYISEVYDNEGDTSKSFPTETQYLNECRGNMLTPPKVLSKESGYNLGTKGSGVYLRHVWGDTCYGLIPNPKENSTAYATTWVYSDKELKAGLLFETQNYSRSESDLPPKQGTWDYKGSRLWINGEEIIPPVWTGVHTERSNEIPLGNENATARPPLEIQLRKGWNRVLIKLPITRFRLPEVRLNKWMFTAAFIDLEDKEALDGISYVELTLK